MSSSFQCVSPVDGRIFAQLEYAAEKQIQHAIERAKKSQCEWQQWSIEQRGAICEKAVALLLSEQQSAAENISWQMGRPIRFAPGEINGFAERARYMVSIAASKLADIKIQSDDQFIRFIQRKPLGVVLSIVPWNYPYLTAVNSVIPALMAGNSVIIKPSIQSPLCGETIYSVFSRVGLPDGVLQNLYLTHHDTEKLISSCALDYVSFTGSVNAGKHIESLVGGCIMDIGLELGGNDPAYVREDANLDTTVENLVDGAYFNSGQSCCAVERIYVHQSCYAEFCERFVALSEQYQLGNPLNETTTLGPMVSKQAAQRARSIIADAAQRGAQPLIDEARFAASDAEGPYLAPQIMTQVDHSMRIMREELFAPLVGVMSVASDQQAIELMNDSDLGLTASIWTQDSSAALAIGEQLQCGTVFMNRCDYLDPALAWCGVKNSGKACSLSELAYERLSRPKSFHMRL